MISILDLQVDELKDNLSEAQELATSSATNLEKHEVKLQMELENMKAIPLPL